MSVLGNRKALAAGLVGLAALLSLPGTAAAALSSCAELLTVPPLAGNPAVFSATSVQATTSGRDYCNVSVVWRDPALVGAAAGYAPGAPPTVDTYQHIRMGFGFPLNTNVGDAAWGGRMVQTAGGGAQGSVASYTGYIQQTPAAIGLSTDSGHGTADSGSGDAWGFVQGQRLNYGKVKDWGGGRAYCSAVVLAKQMAQAYYGRSVTRTYWEGFSGGGHMGHTQLVYCPEEYDGYNISSPARDWQQFRTQDSWAAMVNKKAVQQGQGFTSVQLNSATAAAIAYCMTRGPGGVVVDGVNVLHDPRSCDWNASMHVCGAATAPLAPNCITSQQAVLLNQIFDGPRNSYGKLMYYPYSHGISIGTGTTTASSTAQVMRYNHFDLNIAASSLYMDPESVALAGNPAGAITFEDELNLSAMTTSDFVDASDYKLDRARARGAKIILSHGTHDTAILFRKDPAFYRQVATYFGGGVANYDSLKTWFRLYLMPGAPHTANNFLPQLYDWVENGIPPEKLARTSTGQQRAVCPYPQYAQYLGGSTTDPGNFACGGNLEANTTALCSMVKTPYKGEKGPITNTLELNIDPRICQNRSTQPREPGPTTSR
jgi:feruloyl esterase